MALKTTTLAALAILYAPTAAFAAEPTLPAFDPSNFSAPQPNPYVSLEIGARLVMAGSGSDEGIAQTELATQIVTGPGLKLLGVQTIQVLDEAVNNGNLVERTFDYYATDNDGNLWYFGEDVTNYRYDADGNFTGSDSKSAWRSGVNGAVPGISVAAHPVVGLTLFQEQAPAEGAMDYFEVLSVDETVTGPAGSFTGVVKTFEGSTSETGLREFKFYARGVGLVRTEEELSETLDSPKLVTERQP
ncbi:MAG: hypothetical protein ABL866_14600 [Devosia sp.]